MKKKQGKRLQLHRESLLALTERELEGRLAGGTGNTVDPCYPYSYPRSQCPGDTC